MSLVALLGYAIVCGVGAMICWRGVRMPKKPWLAGLACVCMVILAVSAWNSLSFLNLAMQAYAMGVTDPVLVPSSVWDLASLAVVVKWAPLWLLGGANGSAQ